MKMYCPTLPLRPGILAEKPLTDNNTDTVLSQLNSELWVFSIRRFYEEK